MKIELTDAARAEVRRFINACVQVNADPFLPALVFCLRSKAEGGNSELNGMPGFWDLGSYDHATVPADAIVNASGIPMVIEPGYCTALTDATVDFIDGEWHVS